MPSVTPERHPDRTRRRRNKSDNSRSNSPVSTKRSKHESYSRKDKDKVYVRDNSKRDARNERSDGKKHRQTKDKGQTEENRHRRSYRSRSRSKSREHVNDRAGTSHQSSNSHRRPTNRDHEKSKTDFSRVVIKEEPVSDDEGRRRRHNNRRPHDEFKVKKEPHDGSTDQTSHGEDRENKEESPQLPKEKPNFEVSGKLAEDTNVFNGYVIKYNEPAEAKKPAKRWRLYVFKGEQSLPMIEIHRQSAYLLGRVRKIADIPIDHPSCSKQHAVLQYRAVQYTRDDGTLGRRVRPYIIDLESANGTFVNNQKIEPKKYVELLEKDVLKFGFSSREYVLLHEGSTSDEYEDDNVEFAEVDDSITETKEEVKQE